METLKSEGIFMLISVAIILIFGLLAGEICRKVHLPSLIGMIIVGIAAGPYALGLLDDSILEISSELRRATLIIILIRAGLKLAIKSLEKAGLSAVLMCFVPACLEMAGIAILAPKLLGLTLLESALLGAVIGAVSPAVAVP